METASWARDWPGLRVAAEEHEAVDAHFVGDASAFVRPVAELAPVGGDEAADEEFFEGVGGEEVFRDGVGDGEEVGLFFGITRAQRTRRPR